MTISKTVVNNVQHEVVNNVKNNNIVELAKQFNVSTDYLLGMENTSTISIVGLSQKQVAVLLETIDCFKNPHK